MAATGPHIERHAVERLHAAELDGDVLGHDSRSVGRKGRRATVFADTSHGAAPEADEPGAAEQEHRYEQDSGGDRFELQAGAAEQVGEPRAEPADDHQRDEPDGWPN